MHAMPSRARWPVPVAWAEGGAGEKRAQRTGAQPAPGTGRGPRLVLWAGSARGRGRPGQRWGAWGRGLGRTEVREGSAPLSPPLAPSRPDGHHRPDHARGAAHGPEPAGPLRGLRHHPRLPARRDPEHGMRVSGRGGDPAAGGSARAVEVLVGTAEAGSAPGLGFAVRTRSRSRPASDDPLALPAGRSRPAGGARAPRCRCRCCLAALPWAVPGWGPGRLRPDRN